MKHDGEHIVNFLRNEYGVKKLGVHGESLGGLVVCHIAKQCNLDFACADRTFSSLTNVSKYGFGRPVEKLYRWLTGWTDDNSYDFVNATCYKIITFDPKDEVIPLLGSLRYGVTRRVVERLLGLHMQRPHTPKKRSFEFSPRGLSLLKLKFKSRLQKEGRAAGHSQSIADYSELLTPNQAQALYNALIRLTEVFLEFAKAEYQGSKRHRRASSSDTPLSASRQGKKEQYKAAGRLKRSSDSSLNASNLEKTLIEDVDESAPIILNRGSARNKELNQTSFLDSSAVSMLDDSKTIEEAIADKVDIQREFPVTINAKKSYVHLLSPSDEYSEDLQSFISKVTTNLISYHLSVATAFLIDWRP